jgi:HJR/Mrr/RecB family endonuclease
MNTTEIELEPRHAGAGGMPRTTGQMPMVIILMLGAFLAFAIVPWIAATTIASVLAFLLIRSRLARARKRLKAETYQSEVAAFGWSDDIDPIEFENRCAEAMRMAGWDASTTKGSGDQGVDVVAERDGVRLVLQCKRHSKSVGNKAVQEALSGKVYASADHAAVVTNAPFSKSAVELAEKTGVHLLHFTGLARINDLFGLPHVSTTPRIDRRRLRAERRVARLRRWRLRLVGMTAFALVGAAIHDGNALQAADDAPRIKASDPAKARADLRRLPPQAEPRLRARRP